MDTNITDKRILLIGGPGGVGKTTLAASLAIRLAQQNQRTVVLTVDPAKRLAQALGFEKFSSELQQVPLDEKAAPLYASMLDTRRYFDKLIERFAMSSEQKERILRNPLYQVMVDGLGGTQEYAAMERLLEFSQDQRFDKVIVDTPPTQNAVELLSAPQRLADFMDNSVLRWFKGKNPSVLKFFKKGTKLAMGLLQKIFGEEFLESFAKFLDDFEGMQSGFRNRHLEILELLKSKDLAFILVNLPTEERYKESMAFIETLKKQKIELDAIVLNRLEQTYSLTQASEIRELGALADHYNAIANMQTRWVDAFQSAAGTLPVVSIPKASGPIHDISKLSEIGKHLIH